MVTMSTLYLWIPDANLREDMRAHLQNRRPTDSGVDLMCPEHSWRFGSKLALEIRTGVVAAATSPLYGPVPYLLLARSSTSLTPLRMSNQVGLADAGYRGELIARVDYFGSEDGYTVERGRRLFQIVAHDWLPFHRIVIVDSANDLPPAPDARGEGGFGSTGR